MKKSKLKILMILVALVFILQCNNKTVNQTDDTTKDMISEKDQTNSNEKDLQSNEKITENNPNTKNNQKKDYIEVTNSKLQYYGDLKIWIDTFYGNMISFADEEMKEQIFAKGGEDFYLLEDDYKKLKKRLESIKNEYEKEVSDPNKSIPKVISEGLIKAKDYYNQAMVYRIKSLENIIEMISGIETKKDHEVGNYTDKNLQNYQKNRETYDKFSAGMINQIQKTLLNVNMQLNFKNGEIVEWDKNK